LDEKQGLEKDLQDIAELLSRLDAELEKLERELDGEEKPAS
jgi:archaellum component FlaC